MKEPIYWLASKDAGEKGSPYFFHDSGGILRLL
jgi:hypothetical protein